VPVSNGSLNLKKSAEAQQQLDAILSQS